MKRKTIFTLGLLFALSPVLYFFVGMLFGPIAVVEKILPIILIASPVLLLVGVITWFIEKNSNKNKIKK